MWLASAPRMRTWVWVPRGPVVATETPGVSRSRSGTAGSDERVERLLVEHGRRDAAQSVGRDRRRATAVTTIVWSPPACAASS